MSADVSSIQTSVAGILPHPREHRVLMVLGATGYMLPHFTIQGWWDSLDRLKQRFQEQLGCEINILRSAYYHRQEGLNQAEEIFVLESPTLRQADETALKLNGVWVDREQLSTLPLAYPTHCAIIESYLGEEESGCWPENRRPWAQPGWHALATTWIEQEVAQLGCGPAQAIEPVRTWGLSCVLRVRTTNGVVYFKAGANLPLFVNEPALLVELAAHYPDYLPKPLSIDHTRRWMLLPDIGEPAGDQQVSPATRETILRTFGQLQVDAAGRVAELLAHGCLDRRLERLATQIEPLLNDAEVTAQLTADELGQLKTLIPELTARCALLSQSEIPPSLVHGDLHLGNIAWIGDRPLYFDWTDACISHPFVDALENLRHEKDVALQAHLRDAYLAQWTAYAPLPRLQALWSLALPICHLHLAVSYQYIIAGLEPTAKPEMASAAPRYLREVLKTIVL